MSLRNKYGWLAGAVIMAILMIAMLVAMILWQQLTPAEHQLIFVLVQKNFIFFFGLVVLFLAVGVFILDGVLHNYVIPVVKMKSEIELMRTVNPDHRITIAGSKNIELLAAGINQWAVDMEKVRTDMGARISQARAASDAEKNILAEFLAELPQGMIVCNLEGQILLYNKQAKQLLSDPLIKPASTQKAPTRGYVGIGRSIFSVLENAPLSHALDEINLRLEKKSDLLSSCFIVNHTDRLLRVEATPVLDSMQAFNGFLLMLDDFTERLSEDRQLNAFWLEHSKLLRQSITTLRESIQDHGHTEKTLSDVEKMTAFIDDADHSFAEQFGHSHWPMIDIDAAEFLEGLKYKVEDSSDITLDLAAVDEAVLRFLQEQRDPNGISHSAEMDEMVSIRVDSYAFALTIRMVLQFLQTTLKQNHFKIILHRTFQFVGIDLLWQGPPLAPQMIPQLEKAQISVSHETSPFSVKEVLQNHKADLFAFQDRDADGFARLRLYLEADQVALPVVFRHAPILPELRSSDFDFDLFKQTGFTTALDNEPLTQLTCTVFDTETTGLDPGAGDHIISIGAVRVVNSRLVASDYFDQLVNPQRGIPAESTRFHGITDDMVRSEPTMEKALPDFSRYVGNSILVAHNAAFDMRMLQIYEPATGIKFNQPVLDTLLLSSVVHPAHQNHNLRAIAHRLGINVVGRHTALGDAMATAKLFVKLLPLLAQKGIYTLKDAREASRKSYLSRLKY